MLFDVLLEKGISYRLLRNNALSGRSLRARRLLHGHGVGVPGGLLSRGGFLLGRLEPVENHFD